MVSYSLIVVKLDLTKKGEVRDVVSPPSCPSVPPPGCYCTCVVLGELGMLTAVCRHALQHVCWKYSTKPIALRASWGGDCGVNEL